MTDLAFASDFPPATDAGWRALVDKALKGGDFEKRLVGRTADGIRIEPLYPKAETVPLARAGHAPWRIAQRIEHPDPAEANALALADLEGGADTLVLAFQGAPTARGFGLAIDDVAGLSRLFAGIMPDLIGIAVETAPFDGDRIGRLLAEWARTEGHDPSALALDFGLDPLGDTARTGRREPRWPELSARFAAVAREVRDFGFGGTIVRADSRAYHEAGASEAQELACLLATGIAYLRALEAVGWTIEAAREALSFVVVADADEFLSVAKLRAVRRLWAEVETACGLAPKPVRIAAETAWRMTTRRDPWVNLLRGTMAAFSAGIGGADQVGVLPFSAPLGLPDAFARRLARNTQHLLLEEANVWRVADPVAGAGGFEALTGALCEEAWARFQEIEREGGLPAALASGALAGRIAAIRAKRESAIAARRIPITGTSEFPHLGEAPVSVLMPAPPPDEPPDALPSIRDAAAFEALRDRSDATLAATGARPRVFLANLGPVAAFSARATFAKNLFEAGGIEAVTNDGFADNDALADAFAASGCRIACLCSSDALYASEAVAAAGALRARSASALYLAGRPGELEAALASVGVTRFVFVGCDVPALAREAQALAPR